MALNKSQRRALLAEEMGEDLGDIDMDTIDPRPVAPAGPSTTAPASVTMSAEQFQALIAALAGQQAQTGDLATVMAEALRNNRQPIPENTDQQYHGRSEYNPEGQAVPRPTLPCEYWFAVWDTKERRAVPFREIEPQMCTNDEIRGLATITAGAYTMERADGKRVPVHVVDDEDGFGHLRRRALAFPIEQFSKEQRNNLGLLKTFHQRMELVTA